MSSLFSDYDPMTFFCSFAAFTRSKVHNLCQIDDADSILFVCTRLMQNVASGRSNSCVCTRQMLNVASFRCNSCVCTRQMLNVPSGRSNSCVCTRQMRNVASGRSNSCVCTRQMQNVVSGRSDSCVCTCSIWQEQQLCPHVWHLAGVTALFTRDKC